MAPAHSMFGTMVRVLHLDNPEYSYADEYFGISDEIMHGIEFTNYSMYKLYSTYPTNHTPISVT